MAEANVPKADWESSRVAEPIDFPQIVFSKYASMLSTVLGTKDRHHALQDLEDSLTAYADDTYRSDVTKAAKVRDLIIARSRTERGASSPISIKEAVDYQQRLWHRAIVRLMKRKNLLGEDWVRG